MDWLHTVPDQGPVPDHPPASAGNVTTLTSEGNVRIKNDVDYDQYRKFSSESSLTYTAPADAPKK